MFITAKQVEAQIYKYQRDTGDTGKNLVIDLLKELAEAMGFNSDLLKENHKPNKPFHFCKQDVSLIEKMLEVAKNKEGKRLRCRDYEGAGGDLVNNVENFFIYLAHRNGVPPEEILRQQLVMRQHTKFIVIRKCIREQCEKFEDDINKNFFINVDNSPYNWEGDHMDAIAQMVFLEFILANFNKDISYVRGVYWYFKMEKEHNQYLRLKESGSFLRNLSAEQFEQFKTNIKTELDFDKAVSEDEALLGRVKKWSYIEDGHGKLQDNKMRKKNLITIMEIVEVYAKKYFETVEKKVVMPEIIDEKEDILNEYCKNYSQLMHAIENYQIMKVYLKNHILNKKEESILEIEFRQRFKVAMFGKTK